MKKFSAKGIEIIDQTIVRQKAHMFRTSLPKKLEVITRGIHSMRFDGLNVVVNCGGKKVQSDGRVYLPIKLVRALKLDHDSILYWKLSYTSTGIKITVEGLK